MQENLCHKHPVMTRQITISTILLTFILLVSSGTARPVATVSESNEKTEQKPVMVPAKPMQSSLPVKDFPEAGMKAVAHKHHLLKIEELGKIHRFHKDRIKKVKKHQDPLWIMALVLVDACHIALLVHAFMHLTH